MSISFGFGSGGASTGTYVGNYTGQHYVYGYAGAYPSGLQDYYGNYPVSIDAIVLNGSWSATNGLRYEYDTNGMVLAIYNTSGGTGKLNFTRYFGNGGTVNSDTGDVWTGGGLQGTIYYSTVPSAPVSLALSRTGRDVTVNINGSTNNGGSTITNYWVGIAVDGGGWQQGQNINSGVYVYGSLTPGSSYLFHTFAQNGVGYSNQTVNGPLVIPALPTAPTLSLAKSATTVTLTLGDTTSTDTPSYYVQQSLDNTTWQAPIQVTTSGPRTYAYTGLTPGQTYFYRAYATSAVGQGAYSTVQSVPIATVPSAPVSVTGVRSGRTVAVTVAASTSTGGDPITGYGIQYSNDGGTTWSAAVAANGSLQATFPNLTTGTTYVFRAYATNDIGNSATTSSVGIFISGYGKRYTTAVVTAAVGNGTSVTYTSAGHGFSATDTVDVAGITPITLNVTQVVITAVTANTFTVSSTVTDAYTSGGTVSGFAMILSGYRYTASGWVAITTTQKYTGSAWSSFN